MTSTPSNTGKSLSQAGPPSLPPPPPSSASPAASFERRPSGPAGPRDQSQAAPRKGQALRKQHRNQRKAGSRAEDDDDMAELRAVRNASSRRGQTSITHLLNYSLPSRHLHDHSNPHARSYRRGPSWSSGSGYHAVDKARYVFANYRFVVSPTGDYTKQAVDADEHLDWSSVLQVVASTESQQTSCPICLSEPVAPRMAKCGHIFCLPCLLRFMSSSASDDGPVPEKKARWRKCPICEDTVFISDVRPVRFYAGQESALPRPGDDVILRLMMRNATSTLALPREGGADVVNSVLDVPWHFAANVLDYARIMKGTGAYMEDAFDREMEDLMRQEKEDELLFHEDGEWTQKAVRAVGSAKEKIRGLGEAEVELSSREAAANPVPRRAEADFYFYTSPPHLYLSPLDIRILKTKYGSFSALPSTLLPRVEHISTGHVVDDAMRRRAKYLGHLPQGCLISFLECDWTDIVPAETLAAFTEEIERRRKRNRDKAAQEERERLQAERIEAAAVRGARRQLGPLEEEVTIRYSEPPRDPAAVDPNDFLPLGATPTVEISPRPATRQGFAPLADMSTSPSMQRTVWGTPAIAASPDLAPRRLPEAAVVVNDGWLRDDAFLNNLAEADLAAQVGALGAMEELKLGEASAGSVSGVNTPGTPGPGTPDTPAGVGGGGAGKRKKKQKITLMSTGGKRGL